MDAIGDLLTASSGSTRDRWHLEVRGQAGAEPLRLYFPPRLYRDASIWYEALGQLVRG